MELCLQLAAQGRLTAAPNPMVGAVIVRDGVILGMGHHLKYGGLHAEREALADCRRRGNNPRGATVYVTLEPCRHTGKQPPCTDALIQAGIARVVCARPDPGRESGGGAAVLAAPGIACEFTQASLLAMRLSDPFVKRVTTGLPWVIAKWAQTIDGKIATRGGESKWISGPLLRRRIHRLRARADAIMVGAGTLRIDDPSLTARDVHFRRTARRVIVTTKWDLPNDAKVFQTARQVPTTVIGPPAPHRSGRAATDLAALGVDCLIAPDAAGGAPGVDLSAMLKLLVGKYNCTNVLVEGGSSLLGALLDADLVDEAIVHVAPMVLGDHHAMSAAAGREKGALGQAKRLTLGHIKRLGDELELVYRRP